MMKSSFNHRLTGCDYSHKKSQYISMEKVNKFFNSNYLFENLPYTLDVHICVFLVC